MPSSAATLTGGPGVGVGGPAVAVLEEFSTRCGRSASARVAEVSRALATSSSGQSPRNHETSAVVPVGADEIDMEGQQEPLVVNGKLNFRVRKRTQQRVLEGEGARKNGKTLDDSATAAAPPWSSSRLKSKKNNNSIRVIKAEAEAAVGAHEAAGNLNLPSVVSSLDDDFSLPVTVAAATTVKARRERRQGSRSRGGASGQNQKFGVIKSVAPAAAASEQRPVRSLGNLHRRGPASKHGNAVNSEGVSTTSKLALAEVVLPAGSARTATLLQDTAAPDFWHSSLSGSSGALIANSVVDAAASSLPAAVVSGKALTAPEDLAAALEHLKSADPLLKTVIEMNKGPKFERCKSAFASLVRSIVFQQLATKAAAAIFGRLITLCEGMENVKPNTISRLSAKELRAIGISERKASYLHDLAANFLSGVLSDTSIYEMDDDALMKALTAVKGIGVWSVHMFMLFSLHKPDVLPVGDLGVRKGFQKLYKLKELPTPFEVERIASCWTPYRSLGSWYMWRVIDNVPPLKPIGD